MRTLNRNTIAILTASLVSTPMYIAPALLDSMYAWFSDINQNVVILLYTAPFLASALIAFVLGPVISRSNKKTIIIWGLSSIITGGVFIVFIGGSFFPFAAVGSIFCGIGYALILNATNTLLVEISPVNAAATVAMNTAASALGNMVTMALAGVLARDGNWTRAYLLCFPAIVALILFVILFRDNHRDNSSAQQPISADISQQALFAGNNGGSFILILLIFFLLMIANMNWSTNYSTYVISEKHMGTTVQTGLLSTTSSLGAAIGGFFLAGIVTSRLKRWTVPVCMLIMAVRQICFIMGTESMLVLYITALTAMAVYPSIHGEITATAGKLIPGGAGVVAINAIQGLSGFVIPYILNFIGIFGDGTTTIQFETGLICLLAGVAIAVPVMHRTALKQ